MRRTIFIIFFCCMVTTATGSVATNPNQSEKTEATYNVSQMWTYKARPGEEKSYFIIVKVEKDAKLGTIVHVAMRGLKMKNPRSP